MEGVAMSPIDMLGLMIMGFLTTSLIVALLLGAALLLRRLRRGSSP